MTATNPLLAKWNTPFKLPPFDTITAEHYREAFDVALNENEAEMVAIAENSDAATFQNTIEAMELSGENLSKVASTFFNLSGANTTPDLQEIEREMAPKLAEHSSKIMLNAELFARVKVLFEQQESLSLSAEQVRVLERTHSRFVRAGANLEGDARSDMAEITKRLATLGTSFSQNMLADDCLLYTSPSPRDS